MGICPLAVMRACPEAAKPVTDSDRKSLCGNS
jgi:hypothetical protein